MLSFILAASVSLLLILLVILDTKKPHLYPPGPSWIPLFGSYFSFYKLYLKIGYVHLVYPALSKKYGPLLGLRLGKDRIVVATERKLVKELLSREEFQARPDGFLFRYRAYGQRLGLVFTEGEFFNQQKKFCLKHLKSFGFNTIIMEDRINFETAELLQYLKKSQPNEIYLKFPESLEVSVLNTLWSMIAGERFTFDDPRARHLFDLIHESFRMQDMSGGILNQFPLMRFVLPPVRRSFNKLRIIVHDLLSFFQEMVDNHRKTVTPYENKDFIDAFINEMTKKKDGDSGFTEKQLIVLLMDLFLAGAETTKSTLGFAILYLLHYPHVQEKLHREMDQVVGRDQQPFAQHRSKLVYCEAFISEVQRHASVSPTTVAHRAKEDAIVAGYTIPKDTFIISNLYSVHMDPEHWGDPENFRPERFISDTGELIQDDWVMPFGQGKRKCPGETLAKTSIYLFLTALLHNYVISPKPGSPLPPFKILDGATLTPPSYEVLLKPRN